MTEVRVDKVAADIQMLVDRAARERQWRPATKRLPGVDSKVEALVGRLIRNENEMDAVAWAVGAEPESVTRFQQSLTSLIDVHRETEAQLQALIYNVERRVGAGY